MNALTAIALLLAGCAAKPAPAPAQTVTVANWPRSLTDQKLVDCWVPEHAEPMEKTVWPEAPDYRAYAHRRELEDLIDNVRLLNNEVRGLRECFAALKRANLQH